MNVSIKYVKLWILIIKLTSMVNLCCNTSIWRHWRVHHFSLTGNGALSLNRFCDDFSNHSSDNPMCYIIRDEIHIENWDKVHDKLRTSDLLVPCLLKSNIKIDDCYNNGVPIVSRFLHETGNYVYCYFANFRRFSSTWKISNEFNYQCNDLADFIKSV